MEKMLTPAEVATVLSISPSTLRKYSLLLEEYGVTFKRNAKNSRQYGESDVMAFERFITLIKTDSVTLESAAYAVASSLKSVPDETDESGVMHSGTERHDGDIAGVTLNEVRKLQEEVRQQQEIIDGFRIAQEKRDAYFVQILEELSGEIQRLREQQALPEPEEIPEEPPAPEPEPVKKGFFARIFGK